MAFSLSPFVEVIEKNAAFNVPNLPSTRTGSVLKADYGPAFERTRIDSETTLRSIFKDPTKFNFKDWYGDWNFLQYATSLWSSRAIDAAKITKNTGLALSGGIVGNTITVTVNSGTFAVGDTVTQSVSGETNKTGIVVRIIGTVLYLSDLQGTFINDTVSALPSGATGTITAVGTATEVTLETFQGVTQGADGNGDGALYNQEVAEVTIPSLVTDSHSKSIGTFTDDGAGLLTYTSLTRLRNQAVTQLGTDTISNSATLVVNSLNTLYVERVGADDYNIRLVDDAALAGWNIDVGDIEVTASEAYLFTIGDTITGGTSGATGIVGAVDSAGDILSLTSVSGVFSPGEDIVGLLSGATSAMLSGIANSMILTGFTHSASTPFTILGAVKDVRLTFYHRYVSANNQNIAIAVCSNKASWIQPVSTDISNAFKSFFDFQPDFDNNEFAVLIFEQEDDSSFTQIASERHIVSYTEGARNNFNINIFAEEWFLSNSNYVFCHVAATPAAGAEDVNTGGGPIPVLHHTSFNSIYPRVGVEGSTADVFPATSTTGFGAYDANGYAQGDIETAFDLFGDPETFDINILMAHENAINYASTVSLARKDCIAVVGPFDETQLVGKVSATASSYLTANFGIIDANEDPIFVSNGTYSVVYGNMKYQLDKFGAVNRWMPLIGDVAGLIAANDLANDPWFAVAGTNRGVILNAIKLAFVPNKTNRDDLYVNSINPVMPISGEGNAVVFGQKTSTGIASAFDRLNVRRLFIFIEKAIATAMKPYLFDFNDVETRDKILGEIGPFLAEIKARRGIFDFVTICDETNNTPEVIDANGLVVDVLIKATKVAEFIQINVTAVKTGTEFSELSV